MSTFSFKEKQFIIDALKELRRSKRLVGSRVSFQDVENLIRQLPTRNVWGSINNFMNCLTKHKGKNQ